MCNPMFQQSSTRATTSHDGGRATEKTNKLLHDNIRRVSFVRYADTMCFYLLTTCY